MKVQAFLESLQLDSPMTFMEDFERARLAEMLPILQTTIRADAAQKMKDASPEFKKALELVMQSDLKSAEEGAVRTLHGLDPIYFSDRLQQALERKNVQDVQGIFGYVMLISKDYRHSDERVKNTLSSLLTDDVLKSAKDAFVGSSSPAAENQLKMVMQAYVVIDPTFENVNDRGTVKDIFNTVLKKTYENLSYSQRYQDQPSEIYAALRTALEEYGFDMSKKIFNGPVLDLTKKHISQFSPAAVAEKPAVKTYTPVKRRPSDVQAAVERQKLAEHLLAEQKAVTADLISERERLEYDIAIVRSEIDTLSNKKTATERTKRQNSMGSVMYVVPKDARNQVQSGIRKDNRVLTRQGSDLQDKRDVLLEKKRQLETNLYRVTCAINAERSKENVHHTSEEFIADRALQYAKERARVTLKALVEPTLPLSPHQTYTTGHASGGTIDPSRVQQARVARDASKKIAPGSGRKK